ncbi:MAG: hypothetical protein HYX60_07460 [Legionella longbeachae]|nr:hypothetical protein [Legionella longbeachae]
MITYFLASLLGWYFVIMGLLLISRRDIVVNAMRDLIGQPALMLFVGVITLMIGLLMVLSHNIWVMSWPVIITIFAWLILIGGVVRLFFPDTVFKIWEKTIDKPVKLIIWGIITLLIGLFLLYHVYWG